MDEIRLNGIDVPCVIGDLPFEREREQHLLVNVVLSLDLSISAASDDLCDTVDYAALTKTISKTLRAAKCRLIERAASLVCDACLEDSRVQQVSVEIIKKECVPNLTSAAVRLIRTKK